MSNLNYSAIDETYPVAGQDNNSQGFRGNFAAIKTSLATAETAITTLETNTAKLNATNDFLGNAINNATYNRLHGAVYTLSNITTPQDLSINNGPLQYVSFAGTTSITFKNWPATGKFALVRVHLYSDGNGIRTATLATEAGGVFQILADSNLSYGSANSPVLSLPQNGSHKVLEVWTYTGGAKVFVRCIGAFA